MALNVLQHALGTQYLNMLRSESSSLAAFRDAGTRLTELMAAEATRELPMEPIRVETPLEAFSSAQPSLPSAVVAILRAGLGMVDPFMRLLPDATTGFVGMERDEQTAQARTYYTKVPPLSGRLVYVVDPMLATGGSAGSALELVYREQPAEVRFVCIVAAPEGVEHLQSRFPELEIFAGALDRELDEQKYILPGLGDYGDRLFGTS
jgi:uracil phosphoribosyltransferase